MVTDRAGLLIEYGYLKANVSLGCNLTIVTTISKVSILINRSAVYVCLLACIMYGILLVDNNYKEFYECDIAEDERNILREKRILFHPPLCR